MRVVMPSGRVIRSVTPLTTDLAIAEPGGRSRTRLLFAIPPGSRFLPDPTPVGARAYLGLRGILPGHAREALRFLDGKALRIGRQRWRGRLKEDEDLGLVLMLELMKEG